MNIKRITIRLITLITLFTSLSCHAMDVGYTPQNRIWHDGTNRGPSHEELAAIFFSRTYPNDTPLLVEVIDQIHPTNAFFSNKHAKYIRQGDSDLRIVYGALTPLILECPAATNGNNRYDLPECGCTVGRSTFTPNIEGDEEGCKLEEVTKTPTCKDTSNNLCQVSTGAKFRSEADFSVNQLSFVRNYNSLNLIDVGFGVGWHNKYFRSMSVLQNVLSVNAGDGRGEIWRRVSNRFSWRGDADSDYIVRQSSSTRNLSIRTTRGDFEAYDPKGRLLSKTDTQGKVKTYEYDAENRLIKVSNHYQQFITFTYSTDGKDHVIKVVDAQGVEYGYEYDTNDNLIAVVYPDGDSDPLNNPKRLYHYEDTDFPNHITGITNANGERYATFAYDANGKAIESALAPTTNSVGQQRVQLNYQGVN